MNIRSTVAACVVSFLFLFSSPQVFAQFGSLPDAPHFKKVKNYKHAINLLLGNNTLRIKEIDNGGAQKLASFTAFHKKRQWFIKIIREDCYECETTLFSTEWDLKKQQKKLKWLQQLKATLVLPEKAAIFTLNKRKHLIISYPMINAQTMAAIVRKHEKHLLTLSDNKQHVLYKALFRAGQVFARLYHPLKPVSDSPEEWIQQTPQLHIFDRNAFNEMYDPKNNRIYLLDLASDTEAKEDEYTVRRGLIGTLAGYSLVITSLDKYCVNNEQCLIQAFEALSAGYLSSLPNYNPTALKALLNQALVDGMYLICIDEETERCPVSDKISKHYELTPSTDLVD